MKIKIDNHDVELSQDGGRSGWAGGEVRRRGSRFVSLSVGNKTFQLDDDPDSGLDIHQFSNGPCLSEPIPEEIVAVLMNGYEQGFKLGVFSPD